MYRDMHTAFELFPSNKTISLNKYNTTSPLMYI